MSGFYRRQRRGFGQFLTEEKIEELGPVHASDLLRNLPNFRVAPGRAGRPARRGCIGSDHQIT